MFHVGDTLTLRAPGAQVLGVAPVFTLDNVTRNETGLNINSDIFVSAGGISAFGIDAGPLFEEQVSTHLTDIPLFGENFSVNVPTIRSDPFNIVFDPLAASFVDFNDPCLTFSGMNGLLCDKSGLLAVFNSDGSGKNVFKIANLYDLIDKSGIGCQNNQFVLDGLGRFMCGAEIDTTAFVNNLLALISTTKIGDTSRLLFDPDGGTVYYNGPLPEDLLSGPLPVSDDTDLGSAQRLAGLGFSNDFAAFDIPAGDPFPASVPEPSSLLLLLGGLVSLAIRSTGLRPKGPVS